ncbi:cap binding protein [Trichosporon asahii var. asahii CBS 2479]|uniref:Cap binding protein n=1 Tax=Trichosporon asahii var. asahii (strain ATCC 90039 / CBS 2479 / JCM 2466 / KCTC 7840 / NBRC 103889/ NCYC 2677 / UAMH 7654) TaxID=1186058 RepID=J4UJ53_TRIAS|nr:cap binding protein [Trichosporon asahii var. asahii CBS 2479]EJT51790.1 cap binding protein [Trichosporon asahii var. asahii CBS 2479]
MSVPAAVAEVNEKTLSDALAAAKISDSETAAAAEQPEKKEDDLEEGEIKDDGTPKTVFHDAQHFNVKHPLFAKWTLYYDSPQSKHLPKTPQSSISTNTALHGGWLDDIRKVISFDSVEEFWGMYNNIVPPSQLPGKANYYLFKDPENKNGGKWAIQFPREKTKSQIDKIWLYTMLAAIGETFETPLDGGVPENTDLVTGVIMSCRSSFYRISIWTRQACDVTLTEEDPLMKRIMTIGRHFKASVLGYDVDQKLVTGGFQTEVTFESHKDSEKKGNKARITLGPSEDNKEADDKKGTRKIKADLIERAKIKKQYAKVLAETGVKSERLKPQAKGKLGKPEVNRSETWSAVDDDTLKDDENDDGDDSDAESVASDASDASSALGLAGETRDDDSSDDEAAAFAAREKAMLRGKGRLEKGKAAGGKFERKSFDGQRPGAIGKSPRGKGRDRPAPYSKDRPPHMKGGPKGRGKWQEKEKPVRALSPPVLPEAKEGSMRTIKKEGFSKFHRSASGKKQPNMAARMDVLLEKIRRSK